MTVSILFSGGQDSTTCLAYAMRFWDKSQIHCVFFDYGQRHAKAEKTSAGMICHIAGTRLHIEKIRFPSTSALLDQTKKIATDEKSGLPTSFVPGRNLILLASLASWGYGRDISRIIIGANATDYSGYPDCRPHAIHQFELAIRAALDTKIVVDAPLINLSKKEIVERGVKWGAMGWLAYSHTCYYGVHPGCGECPSCVIRARGFEEAGVKDPLFA